jgi:hypothetical protein
VRFEKTDELRGAEFVDVDLSGSAFQNVRFEGAHFREAYMADAHISGYIGGLTVNGIEIAPLIDAEMERRHPERAKLRPNDVEGAQEAWAVIEQRWAATKARMQGLTDEQLSTRVDDEWSAIETLRHLVFVTDLWFYGNLFGLEDHYWRGGQVPSFLPPHAFGLDPAAAPSLDEVVFVREQRLTAVREYVDQVATEQLNLKMGEYTPLQCLLVLLDEEWHHDHFLNRDLDVLARRQGGA